MPNVVFLLCDALRAHNLGCYGYDKDTSPEIDKIAGQASRFSNAFCTINTTDPSQTTIFSGKYPRTHGVVHHGGSISEREKSYTSNITSLSEILHDSGYATVSLDWLGKWHKRGYDIYGGLSNKPFKSAQTASSADTGQRAGSPQEARKTSFGDRIIKRLSRLRWLPGRGAWYYYLPAALRTPMSKVSLWWNCTCEGTFSRKTKPIISDSAGLADLAIKYIRHFGGKKDFLLFVHFWDNHIPYTAPESTVRSFLRNYKYPQEKTSAILKQLNDSPAIKLITKATRGKTPSTTGEIMARYDASVKYVDHNIGRIYRTLEEMSILDDTVFVITADHGESLGEHDIFFDHHGLYDPEVRVPLIIRHPALPAGAAFDELVQHFDIMPTILDLVGLGNVDIAFDGDSLLKLTRDKVWNRRFVFAEETAAEKKRMIRDHNFKYIAALSDEKCAYCQKYHAQGDEFYDLNADSQEMNNIISDPRHLEYKGELERYIGNLEKPREGQTVTFDDEEEVNRRLRALGYL
jgi:arylsulfatase A-like enzyme